MNRSLEKDQRVYTWVDSAYNSLHSEEAKLCAPVIVNINELGGKHFMAIKDGVRESKQSWQEVLQKLKDLCMKSLR